MDNRKSFITNYVINGHQCVHYAAEDDVPSNPLQSDVISVYGLGWVEFIFPPGNIGKQRTDYHELTLCGDGAAGWNYGVSDFEEVQTRQNMEEGGTQPIPLHNTLFADIEMSDVNKNSENQLGLT